MKSPYMQGEGCPWGHEMTRLIRDKLRKAYDAVVISSMGFDRRAMTPNGFERRSGSGCEDPIRRVMFLGPWSHTWGRGVFACRVQQMKWIKERLMISFVWIHEGSLLYLYHYQIYKTSLKNINNKILKAYVMPLFLLLLFIIHYLFIYLTRDECLNLIYIRN